MKILVATDGSRGSSAALTFAAKLANLDAAELIVLTVDPGNGIRPEGETVTGGGKYPTAVRPEARRALDAAAREIKRRNAKAQFHLVSARRKDEIPEAIAREAERVKADLVVVGSEGRDTLNEWVVGGVALRLIYVARRPVTVVRPPRRRKAG